MLAPPKKARKVKNKGLRLQALKLEQDERNFSNWIIALIQAVSKKDKYKSGLVKSTNHIGEISYHWLYELKKPFKYRSKDDNEIYHISHTANNFMMSIEGGLGSVGYKEELTRIQLISLYEHIDAET